jgi:hypothetical protein
MNRQVWRAVIVTGLLLSAASLWPSVQHLAPVRDLGRRFKPAALGESAASLMHVAGPAVTSMGGRMKALAAEALESSSEAPSRLALDCGALALALGGLALWLMPRTPRRRVLALVARGVMPSRIARRTGFSQDAIRAMLQVNMAARPAALSRQDLPGGKIVRRRVGGSAPGSRRKALPPQGATALRRAMARRHEGC